MGSERITRFICDRCGDVVIVEAAVDAIQPTGWHTAMIWRPPLMGPNDAISADNIRTGHTVLKLMCSACSSGVHAALALADPITTTEPF